MLLDIIKPMEPKLYRTVDNHPRFRYQIKWDGVRMLAFVHGNQVRLQNRQLRDRTVQYPEIGELGQWLKCRDAILDGEIIVLDEAGKPSFPRVIKRDFATQPMRIKGFMKEYPVVFTVFDILYLDGRKILDTAWEERMEMLAGIITPTDRLHTTESFADGEALFQAIRQQGLEGVVAKELGSPYIIGKKSEHWRKVKNLRQDYFVVGGLTLKQGRVSALLLGAYHQEEFWYVGSAGSGLTGQHLQLLQENIQDLKVTTAPFCNPPRIATDKRLWVRTHMVVKVEYLEWTDDFKLRAPVILGFVSKEPHQCRF